MNDRDVILSAIRGPAPQKATKKKVRFIDSEAELIHKMSKDVISEKIANKIKKTRADNTHKSKSIWKWSSTDFILHLQHCLSTRSVRIEKKAARDRQTISLIYDNILTILGPRMNNAILRDYFAWWARIYGDNYRGSDIHLEILNNHNNMRLFISTIQETESDKTPVTVVNKQVVQSTLQDAVENLHLGGISRCLLRSGIVFTNKCLIDSGEESSLIKIQEALMKFSKDALKSIVNVTLASGPYPEDYRIDFMSLSRKALTFHGMVKEFSIIDYKEYFTRSVV